MIWLKSLLLGFTLPLLSYGQAPDESEASLARTDGILSVEDMNIGQVLTLERFLNLPPDRLESIRETIEAIEQMSKEERFYLRQQIQNYKKIHNQLRTNVEQDVSLKPSQCMLLAQHLTHLTPEKRIRELNRIRKMDLKERMDLFHDLSQQYRLDAGKLKRESKSTETDAP